MKRVDHVKTIVDRTLEPTWPLEGRTLDGEHVVLASAARTMTPTQLANVYFIDEKKGVRVYPWREAGYMIDGRGNALAPTVAEDEPEMTREHLESVGFTDDELARRFRAQFPDRKDETEALDSHGDSRAIRALRYRLYWELLYALY